MFFSVSPTCAEDEVPTSYPPLPEALAGCSTWNDVIAKYQAYVNGQAAWGDLVACYQQVSLIVTSDWGLLTCNSFRFNCSPL
jgi:hypothetical protein